MNARRRALCAWPLHAGGVYRDDFVARPALGRERGVRFRHHQADQLAQVRTEPLCPLVKHDERQRQDSGRRERGRRGLEPGVRSDPIQHEPQNLPDIFHLPADVRSQVPLDQLLVVRQLPPVRRQCALDDLPVDRLDVAHAVPLPHIAGLGQISG